MHLALVHYAAPPVIGGVERVIEQQARVLAERGHEVVILCGNEGAAVEHGAGISLQVHPLLKAGAPPEVVAAGAARLKMVLASYDCVIIHNMLTMPFNAAAAQALGECSRELSASKPGVRFINWVHDFDICRETFEALGAVVRHVAVSQVRQKGFCERMGIDPAACPVIPNGVDLAAALGLTPFVAQWAEQQAIFRHAAVLLHPTRILARKNLELGLAIVAALRDLGADVAYVVTGAPDPHRKESAAYAEKIRGLVEEWDLGQRVYFVSAAFPVQTEDVASLYRLADALLFPSKSEGFGLPLVEAALHRLPIFCSDIPPHREVAAAVAEFFDLDAAPEAIARQLHHHLQNDAERSARKALAMRYSWNHIYKEYLEPLIKER